MTKAEFQEYLNEIPAPQDDLESNGGRIPDHFADRWGDWMRRNDPIAFQVGWQEKDREEHFREEQEIAAGERRYRQSIIPEE